MNNPNTPMLVSELIKNMAIDAAETLRPKNNKTVIELPDLQEMIGLLGNFRPEGNAVMQPQVNDMPSYDMMLAENGAVDPRVENPEAYMYDNGYRGPNPIDSVPSTEFLNENLDPEFAQEMEYNNSNEGYYDRLQQYKEGR